MADGRSQRKPNVVPFLTKLDRSREANLTTLIARAKQLLPSVPGALWEEPVWTITGGRLARLSGKNVKKPTLGFHYAPKLGGDALENEWAELAKALVVLRFHRDQQNITNQRTFVHAISYVAHAAKETSVGVSRINPETLDQACRLIGNHYSASSAYNLHKGINELAAHLDSNKLCKMLLDYRYAGLRRPSNTGGVGFRRLDSPEVREETQSDKMVDASVYELIGEFYRRVPTEHPSRIYVLMLTLLACLGRRFSEIALLPNQVASKDDEGNVYVNVFGRKQSRGETFTPSRQVFCISASAEIVQDVLAEARGLCAPARQVAAQMRQSEGPDLRFLEAEEPGQRYYQDDLRRLGLSDWLLQTEGWIRTAGFAQSDDPPGKKKPKWYTTLEGIKAYCRRDYYPSLVDPVHIDQAQRKYYLEDLLFVRFRYLGGSFKNVVHAFWLATPVSHVMVHKWMERQLPGLAREYASEVNAKLDFTSHQFRHTINTLLDEGGLPELMQTRWFLRKNPRDTKAYQHTSREKNVLGVREAILSGRATGVIIRELEQVPVNRQEAYLQARVKAVHDVGTGICVHNFAQTPCERHLQCQAECRDYLHVRGDEGRVDEMKRIWAITKIAQETAEAQSKGRRPRLSADWMAHNRKKLKVLERQLEENSVQKFDPHAYLKEKGHAEAQ